MITSATNKIIHFALIVALLFYTIVGVNSVSQPTLSNNNRNETYLYDSFRSLDYMKSTGALFIVSWESRNSATIKNDTRLALSMMAGSLKSKLENANKVKDIKESKQISFTEIKTIDIISAKGNTLTVNYTGLITVLGLKNKEIPITATVVIQMASLTSKNKTGVTINDYRKI